MGGTEAGLAVIDRPPFLAQKARKSLTAELLSDVDRGCGFFPRQDQRTEPRVYSYQGVGLPYHAGLRTSPTRRRDHARHGRHRVRPFPRDLPVLLHPHRLVPHRGRRQDGPHPTSYPLRTTRPIRPLNPCKPKRPTFKRGFSPLPSSRPGHPPAAQTWGVEQGAAILLLTRQARTFHRKGAKDAKGKLVKAIRPKVDVCTVCGTVLWNSDWAFERAALACYVVCPKCGAYYVMEPVARASVPEIAEDDPRLDVAVGRMIERTVTADEQRCR